MIEIDGLTKLYGSFVAVDGLSVRVEPGEVLGLVGPNGAGKTTTLRCLVGIIPPSTGAVRICGHDLRSEPLEAKRALAFMPDEPRLFDYLTVWEHLQFVGRVYGTGDCEARAQALLDELELADKRDVLPTELSRGMKQKLVLACGLLHAPRVLVCDEPLTGLDPVGIRSAKAIVTKCAHDGASVIVSSHLLQLVEELCDRILILKSGKKLLHGTLDEIRRGIPGLGADESLEEVFLHVTDSRKPAGAAA